MVRARASSTSRRGKRDLQSLRNPSTQQQLYTLSFRALPQPWRDQIVLRHCIKGRHCRHCLPLRHQSSASTLPETIRKRSRFLALDVNEDTTRSASWMKSHTRANTWLPRRRSTSAVKADSQGASFGACWTIDGCWRYNAWTWCSKGATRKRRAL